MKRVSRSLTLWYYGITFSVWLDYNNFSHFFGMCIFYISFNFIQVSRLKLLDIIHITVKYFYQQYIESSSTSLHFYYLTVNMQHEWCLNRMNAFFATLLSMEAYNGLALFASPTIVSNRISFIKESWIHWRFTFSW